MTELPQVLALDVAGTPGRWIPAIGDNSSAYYCAKGLIAWEMSPVTVTLRGGTNAKTGLQSTMTISTIIAIRGSLNAKQSHYANHTPPLSNKALFRRDKNVCAYCGNVFHTKDLTRDHVTPKAQNGRNIWTNCVTACAGCNKYKDDRTPEQAHMKLLYVPYAPNRAEWLILENRKILTDQMDFLMKQVPKHSRLHID